VQASIQQEWKEEGHHAALAGGIDAAEQKSPISEGKPLILK
jgi:hypothetical protein